MKTFFIIYWTVFGLGWLATRSYKKYYRKHIQRHHYAERHRRNLHRLQGAQPRLF